MDEVTMRRWLIAGWFAWGLVGGILIEQTQIRIPDLLWAPVILLALIPFVHIGEFVKDGLEARRHGGLKPKQCLVKTRAAGRCPKDTRKEGGRYGWFCADHQAVIGKMDARWVESPNRETKWGDYEFTLERETTTEHTLREDGYPVYRLDVMTNERWVPVLQGLVYVDMDD